MVRVNKSTVETGENTMLPSQLIDVVTVVDRSFRFFMMTDREIPLSNGWEWREYITLYIQGSCLFFTLTLLSHLDLQFHVTMNVVCKYLVTIHEMR